MSHVEGDRIHAYANRGLDVRVSITTDEEHTDFTSIMFRVGAGVIVKTGLTADDTATGVDVDFTLTADELDLTPATLWWELLAMFGGQVRTLAEGPFTVDPEPTSEDES